MRIFSVNNIRILRQAYEKFGASGGSASVRKAEEGLKLVTAPIGDTFTKTTRKLNTSNTLEPVFKKSLEDQELKLKALGKQLLDTTEVIALQLKDFGVSFNRSYCEGGVVKKTEACLSKLKRSGIPQDRVRTTIYNKNIYDLSLMDRIIQEYSERGYVVNTIKVPLEEAKLKGYLIKPKDIKNGKVDIQDISIRLNNTIDEPILNMKDSHLPFIDGANKNGYSDIQIRFVNKNLKHGYETLPHEVIILMGENYAKAKHEESEYVYKIIRQFKLLNIAQDTNISNPARQQASRYADLIKNMLSDEISSKLFENAKNKDLYGIIEENPIKINKNQIKLLDSYFNGLHAKLTAYYRGLQDATTDIKVKKALNSKLLSDREAIGKIQAEVTSSIAHFNSKIKASAINNV